MTTSIHTHPASPARVFAGSRAGTAGRLAVARAVAIAAMLVIDIVIVALLTGMGSTAVPTGGVGPLPAPGAAPAPAPTDGLVSPRGALRFSRAA